MALIFLNRTFDEYRCMLEDLCKRLSRVETLKKLQLTTFGDTGPAEYDETTGTLNIPDYFTSPVNLTGYYTATQVDNLLNAFAQTLYVEVASVDLLDGLQARFALVQADETNTDENNIPQSSLYTLVEGTYRRLSLF